MSRFYWRSFWYPGLVIVLVIEPSIPMNRSAKDRIEIMRIHGLVQLARIVGCAAVTSIAVRGNRFAGNAV